MVKARTLVGLDVHAAKIVAAVLDVQTGEVGSFRPPGDPSEAAGSCSGLGRPVLVTYAAAPAGYGLARELERRGVRCVVCAPGKIPRASRGSRSAGAPSSACTAPGGAWSVAARAAP